MKAIDYYEKHGAAVIQEFKTDDGKTDAAVELLRDFMRETKKIISARKAQKDRAVVSAFREQNAKWNALCGIFQKKDGVSPLRRDGFWLHMKSQIPEIEKVK